MSKAQILDIKSDLCRLGEEEIPLDIQVEIDLQEELPSHLGAILTFILDRVHFDSLHEVALALSSFCFLYPLSKIKVNFPSFRTNFSIDKKESLHIHEEKPWGNVIILFENSFSGLYLLQIAPGASIPPHQHFIMDESELLLTDDLLLQRQSVKSGSAIHWQKEFVHTYDNQSDEFQNILCIDHPKFIPEDEVVTEATSFDWPGEDRIKTYWK